MAPGVEYGSVTLDTCESRANATKNVVTCSSTAGSRTDGVPLITTCTAPPACALKFAANKFDARVDSEFGAVKFVEKFVPTADDNTFTPTSATNQSSTTRRRRL